MKQKIKCPHCDEFIEIELNENGELEISTSELEVSEYELNKFLKDSGIELG